MTDLALAYSSNLISANSSRLLAPLLLHTELLYFLGSLCTPENLKAFTFARSSLHAYLPDFLLSSSLPQLRSHFLSLTIHSKAATTFSYVTFYFFYIYNPSLFIMLLFFFFFFFSWHLFSKWSDFSWHLKSR